MQNACAIVSSVASLALPYISTLSHKRHDIQKKKILNIKCFDFLYTTSVCNASHSKKNSARYIINVGLHRPSCKVPVIPDCNET